MAKQKFSLGIVLSAIDKVTVPLQKVQQKFKGFSDNIDRVKTKFKFGSDAIGLPGVKKSFSGLLASLKPVGVALAGLGVAGAGAFAVIKSSADNLDNLGDFSKTVGINVKAIQEWRYAAQNAGSSSEDLDEGLKKFTLSMGQARAGSGKMLGFLNKVNPAFAKQLLSVKSNEQGFELMIGALAKVEDPQRRLALATAAFGTAGESLARVAGEGSDKLGALRAEARKLGLATEEDTEKAGEFNDNLSKMLFALEAVKNKISVNLMPVLIDFFKKITTWLGENQEKVKALAGYLADNLPGAIEKTISFFSTLINSPITKFLLWIVDILGAANIAFVAIGLYVAGTFISILASLVTLLTSLGITFTSVWLAALGPIGWVIAGVLALGAASIAIYTYWDDICGMFEKAWKWVSKIAGIGWDKISNLWSSPKGDPVSGQASQKVAGAQALGAQQMGQRYFENASSQKSQTDLKVSFDNLPKGARVQTEKAVNSNVDLSMGYSMVTP